MLDASIRLSSFEILPTEIYHQITEYEGASQSLRLVNRLFFGCTENYYEKQLKICDQKTTLKNKVQNINQMTTDYSFFKKINYLAFTIFNEITTYNKFKFFKEILGNSCSIRLCLLLFFSKSGFCYPSQLLNHQNLEKAQLIAQSETSYNFLNTLEGLGCLPFRDDDDDLY